MYKNIHFLLMASIAAIIFSACSQQNAINSNYDVNNIDNRFLNSIPNDRYYTTTHEWIMIVTGTSGKVGVTPYFVGLVTSDYIFAAEGSTTEDPRGNGNPGQSQLPRPLDKPKPKALLSGSIGDREVLTPVDLWIMSYNSSIFSDSTIIVTDPYGTGYISNVDSINISQLGDLMNATQYQQYLDSLNNQ